MTDENKTPEEVAENTAKEVKKDVAESAAKTSDKAAPEKKTTGRGRWARPEPSRDNPLGDKPEARRKGWKWGRGWGRWGDKNKEYQEILLEVRRVTRVTTGGRQLAFRAIIVIGNGKGKIGLWVAKGNDVSIAVRKATHEAYKNVVQAPVTEELTVPYGMTHKYKSAIVKIMPATVGTGLKAWSSVRTVLELAWYNNILSKIIGTNNKLNNAICAIQALAKYKVGKTPPKQWDAKKAKADAKSTWEDKKAPKTEDKKEVAAS